MDSNVIVLEGQSKLNRIPIVEIFAGERDTGKNGENEKGQGQNDVFFLMFHDLCEISISIPEIFLV